MVEYKYTIEKSPEITLRGVRRARKSIWDPHTSALSTIYFYRLKKIMYYVFINAFLGRNANYQHLRLGLALGTVPWTQWLFR